MHKTSEATRGFRRPNQLKRHFTGIVGLYYRFADVSFTMLVPSASHDDVITWLGHDKNWLQGLVLIVGSRRWDQLSSLKWKLQSSQLKKIILPPFFVGFTGKLKTTTPSTVSVYITLCNSLTGALSWLSENEIHNSKNRKSIYGSQCRECGIHWIQG